MNVSDTATVVRAHFNEQAAQWGLSPQSLRIDYIPSPGGFGPMNFVVHDGKSAYHLKLTRTPDELSAWMRAAPRLAVLYRAPRLLAQIELGGRYGAVFERLPGNTPTWSIPFRLLDQIVNTLRDLHQDRELAAELGGGARPARATFLEYHIQMCEEDLSEIQRSDLPPFIDKTGLGWMLAETKAMRERALHSGAFEEEVSNPIHGDLWFGNVLVDGDRWWIIDWDDLRIGDPAHDLSLILLTTVDKIEGASRWLRGRDTAFIERFELYARAALLTFVIDPIADWIEADSFPEVRAEARAHREALHRRALARYRNLYACW